MPSLQLPHSRAEPDCGQVKSQVCRWEETAEPAGALRTLPRLPPAMVFPSYSSQLKKMELAFLLFIFLSLTIPFSLDSNSSGCQCGGKKRPSVSHGRKSGGAWGGFPQHIGLLQSVAALVILIYQDNLSP